MCIWMGMRQQRREIARVKPRMGGREPSDPVQGQSQCKGCEPEPMQFGEASLRKRIPTHEFQIRDGSEYLVREKKS